MFGRNSGRTFSRNFLRKSVSAEGELRPSQRTVVCARSPLFSVRICEPRYVARHARLGLTNTTAQAHAFRFGCLSWRTSARAPCTGATADMQNPRTARGSEARGTTAPPAPPHELPDARTHRHDTTHSTRDAERARKPAGAPSKNRTPKRATRRIARRPQGGFPHEREAHHTIHPPRAQHGQGRLTDGPQRLHRCDLSTRRSDKQESLGRLGGRGWRAGSASGFVSLAVPSNRPIRPRLEDDPTGRSSRHADDTQPAARTTNNASWA